MPLCYERVQEHHWQPRLAGSLPKGLGCNWLFIQVESTLSNSFVKTNSCKKIPFNVLLFSVCPLILPFSEGGLIARSGN